MRSPAATLLVLATTVLFGCGREREDLRGCSGEEASLAAELPPLLSEMELCEDIASEALAADAVAFKSRFPLWTDGAAERRWLLLPDGLPVDIENVDEWVFPVGAWTFKEFTRDGVRVETRMNLKSPYGWAAAAYVWTADGRDV